MKRKLYHIFFDGEVCGDGKVTSLAGAGRSSSKSVVFKDAGKRYHGRCGMEEPTPSYKKLDSLVGSRVTFVWGDPVRVKGILEGFSDGHNYAKIRLPEQRNARVWLHTESIFARTLRKM
jgi:hypothetical protein